jgi:hypothetical protein
MKPVRIILIVLIFSLSYCSPAMAQDWDKTFGGTEWDFGYSIQQTTDGGYIIAGSTAGTRPSADPMGTAAEAYRKPAMEVLSSQGPPYPTEQDPAMFG